MTRVDSIFAPGLFDGQVAIVTGGGTGIGIATASELASLGAKIAIVNRKAEHVDAGLAELSTITEHAWGTTADLRDASQCETFVRSVLDRFGKVDVLINNAGGQFPSPAHLLTPKGWEAVVRNNLNGLFYMTLATANLAMIPARRGRIVNVIAEVERGFPGMVHTGAARAGVQNMTKTLSVEWAPFNIRVNACAPGVVRSSGTLQYGEEALEAARRAVPLKRCGTPEEVSRVLVFLASDRNDYVTGATYLIDGGSSLWGDIFQIDDPTE